MVISTPTGLFQSCLLRSGGGVRFVRVAFTYYFPQDLSFRECYAYVESRLGARPSGHRFRETLVEPPTKRTVCHVSWTELEDEV